VDRLKGKGFRGIRVIHFNVHPNDAGSYDLR
jgi:hypothetical protein